MMYITLVSFPCNIEYKAMPLVDDAAEERIRTLVHTFYARIREDDVLGPIFNGHIGDEWEPHLQKMCDFWSSILYATGRFNGNPIRAHAQLPDIRSQHFDRWIEMFTEVAYETMPEPEADDVARRALRMRVVLESHLPIAQEA
ncbi:MAG: group III truncated hemoglobin [Gemmatimonadales bacterium]|jgi:hemoglobin|nr:group III truncated hemoglobin [Gemmatimonadales bacterium]MBT3498108.1 group III truncated hemoglobin [Gemmatimonadales bacterium]MBT3775485.1 group III truncated hemoglobin [Gemmatimonadales bacterium]MBT3959943.1 group III truncated hemoglobin [Gemmatimonadales bacterium]MBT4187653.1 group III truncated hemoglobin [Gemmatimonadales bacterium]